MTKAKNILALSFTRSGIKIELIALVDESTNSRMRTEEVKELLVKAVLLGRKRGRPSRKDDEFQNAA